MTTVGYCMCDIETQKYKHTDITKDKERKKYLRSELLQEESAPATNRVSTSDNFSSTRGSPKKVYFIRFSF
jgi:hypothetical protein